MAGFFGFFDYTKPGKGIDPDAPQKHPFFLFFELYWRKFSKFLLINLIYFVLLMPVLCYLYMLFYGTLVQALGIEISEVMPLLAQVLVSTAVTIPGWLQIFLLLLSVVLIGPATAGMTYMFRNYARQEHAWISDLFVRAKSNFGQALFFGLLDAVMFLLLRLNLSYLFGNATLPAADFAATLFRASAIFSGLILVIYLFMRHYFYMLLVTFNLSIGQILKNSFLLAILGLWRNFLVLILNLLLGVLVFLIHPVAEIIAVPLLFFSLTGFITVFICYPVVKKIMLDPLLAAENREADGEEEAGSEDLENRLTEADEDKKEAPREKEPWEP